MASPSPFREVYVEIPTMRKRVLPLPIKSTPAGRRPLGLVPIVEIPHSPLWRGKHGSQMDKDGANKIPALHIKSRLSENLPHMDVDASKKRKMEEPVKKERGRPKKQRVDEQVQPAQEAIVEPAPLTKPVIRRPRKIVVPPCPVWQSVPDAGTRESIEDRIMIWEYFHRFAALLRIPKTHRDALDDFSMLSEQLVKSMIGCLLELLLADAQDESEQELQLAKAQVRKKDTTTPQIATVLRTLSEFSIPNLTKVKEPTDLIPAIISLIEASLTRPSVYDDLALGVEEARKFRTEADEAIKLEKEKWANKKAGMVAKRDKALAVDAEAKTLAEAKGQVHTDAFDLKGWRTQYRTVDDAHKAAILLLQLKVSQALSPNQLRFGPAGIDHEGRVYYILSIPGDIAKAPAEDDRQVMKRWAWFLASWSNEGKWEGIHQVQEIRNLVKWIEFNTAPPRTEASGDNDNELDGESATSSGSKVKSTGIKTLVKNLNHFADFLDWKFGN